MVERFPATLEPMRKGQRFTRADIVSVIVIIVTVFVFFSRLFWPESQLIVTPDFGRSDAWHSSFAAKFFFSESLARSELPLWNPYVGTGFPVHAEGLTGTFFLVNFILFRIFNVVFAYNLALCIFVLLFGLGVYAWLRILRFDPIPALLGGVAASFSGITISHLTHLMILPGLATMPYVFLATELLNRRVTVPRIALVAVLFAQQHFGGFPQITLISFLFALLSSIFAARILKTIRPIGALVIASTLSLPLAAAQLIPSYEFFQNSTASAGFSPSIASYFSYPFKHLITLVVPFALGNPKYGTYPDFETLPGSIFWENSGYIGVGMLLFALGAFLPNIVRTRRTVFFSVALVLSLLSMTGRHSPIYFVYALWPFTLFRVPSRFLFLFTLALIALAVSTAQTLWKAKKRVIVSRGIVLIVLLATYADLTYTWWNYHLIAPASEWLTPPYIASVIPQGVRFATVSIETAHNAQFMSQGWDRADVYAFLREGAAPNSNSVWHLSAHDVYAGRYLKRPAVIDGLLSHNIEITDTHATASALAVKLLSLESVGWIITPLTLNAEGYTKTHSMSQDGLTINVYSYPAVLPRIYLVRNAIEVKTVEEAVSAFLDKTFVPGKTVLVEQPLSLGASEASGTAHILSESNQSIAIAVQNPGPAGLLVLADTFYPGWEATVNGALTPIIPVNIRQRAVIVPAGETLVRFTFAPISVRIGLWISLIAHLAIGIRVVFAHARPSVRIAGKVPSRGVRHPSNRDR